MRKILLALVLSVATISTAQAYWGPVYGHPGNGAWIGPHMRDGNWIAAHNDYVPYVGRVRIAGHYAGSGPWWMHVRRW